jgi:hypothetical protein
MVLRRVLGLLFACAVLALGSGCETDSGKTAGGDDVASDPGGGGGGGDCDAFCTDVVEACPEEDTMETCLHSCESVGTDPGDDALTCAADATDCTAVHACWQLLFPPTP